MVFAYSSEGRDPKANPQLGGAGLGDALWPREFTPSDFSDGGVLVELPRLKRVAKGESDTKPLGLGREKHVPGGALSPIALVPGTRNIFFVFLLFFLFPHGVSGRGKRCNLSSELRAFNPTLWLSKPGNISGG